MKGNRRLSILYYVFKIRKEKERIEKEIRDLRETMNSHLDKEQEKLTRELMEVEVKTNNGIQELLTTLQRKEEK
jgi:hypothetical protein